MSVYLYIFIISVLYICHDTCRRIVQTGRKAKCHFRYFILVFFHYFCLLKHCSNLKKSEMCDDGEVVGPGEGLVGRHPVEDIIEAEALIGEAGVDQAHDQGREHGFYWQMANGKCT
jgi:hypothetical protein